jgi:hypothetical protein
VAIDFEALFGKNSPVWQLALWGVLQQILGAGLAPALQEITNDVNSLSQQVPLSPPDLADLVVRNYLDMATAEGIAKKSGVSADDFAHLVKNAGAAPDTTMLMEGFRRRVLEWDSSSGGLPSVLDGIREGRLADKWAPLIQALGEVPIGVADAVDGVVENQISFDVGAQAAYENGLSKENFQILVDIRGNPPGPAELMEMVRRSIIPVDGTGPGVLSLTQGISEGATKDKWIPALKQLLTVLPPEGRVVTLLRAGAITQDQAIGYFKQLGYDQTMAAAFAAEASHGKTQHARDLARGDLEKLYADKLIDAATFTSMVGALGYNAAEAGDLMAIQDMHKATAVADAAVSRIRGYYIARKIDDQTAAGALASLKVPADSAAQYLTAWRIDRDANVKLLTEAQVADAWLLGILTDDQAYSSLQALGYTQFDAWVILSLKNKGPLPGAPAPGPNPL